MMPSLSRRRFLQASAATAAAVATTARAAAPSEQINFALMGAGSQGRHIAGRLLEVPGTRLAAVCEINPENAALVQEMGSEVKVYDDWNELLNQERDLNAVVIGLPEDTHAAAAIAAMNAGRDVFCEKPMAYSPAQSHQMIAARNATQRVLQIGQQRRSNPLYYLAERLIQKDGAIGEVLRIDAFWDRWSDWKRPLPDLEKDFAAWGYPTLDHLINWRLYRRYGHGLMTENGTHQMDAASWLLGGKRPTSVCGMGAIRYDDHRETHDIVSADYMFEGDTIVRFTQDFHQGLNYGWSYGELVLGSEGALRVTAEQEIVLYDRDRRAKRIPIAEIGDIELGGVVANAAELKEAEADREGGGLRTFSYRNEMRIFDHAVRNRTQPTCTGEIGHNAIVMTVTGTESQFAGKFCEFAPETWV
ncbi:MAG: Gfo/Idh/MocA family oxidoreductase [Pirellulales bacterium]